MRVWPGQRHCLPWRTWLSSTLSLDGNDLAEACSAIQVLFTERNPSQEAGTFLLGCCFPSSRLGFDKPFSHEKSWPPLNYLMNGLQI